MVNIAVWFRRDLRIEDNSALNAAIRSGGKLLPVFIFDDHILNELEEDDHRVSFIYDELNKMDRAFQNKGGRILVKKGEPLKVWKELIDKFNISAIYTNRDYEPYALKRDKSIKELIESMGGSYFDFKDHVIMEPGEVLKDDGLPYTIYTPFKKRWLSQFNGVRIETAELPEQYLTHDQFLPELHELGKVRSSISIPDFSLENLENYSSTRDIPALDSTTRIGPHLRFGTISVRKLVQLTASRSETFLSELIWREFFIQILFHFPQVVHQSFRPQYDRIKWNNDPHLFEMWCTGSTGYPMVDAGMRELNATGHMHNRVRMVVASFLCKHLLIDWRWGEAYFARKLSDFELASNNGNWQWAAGTGCDAAPYFRVFNPSEQLKKFDPQMIYVKKWIPELLSGSYAKPIVEHSSARNRAIATYKEALQSD
jgi:deoxyribodipyrimidine photo-lyase